MELEIIRQVNSDDDVAIITIINFSREEHDALTATRSWEDVIFDGRHVPRGFWRESYKVRNLTFLDFVSPGIRITNFTSEYADRYEVVFKEENLDEVRQLLTQILDRYRRQLYNEQMALRDAHYGRSTNRRIA